LDGTDEHIVLGTGAQWDVFATTDAITIEACVVPDATGADMIFAGYVTGTGGEACFPQVLIESSGYAEFRPTQDTGETSAVTGSTNLTGGVHHIIATFAESDDIADLLVDGGETEYATVTLSCTNDTLQTLGAENAYIGCRNNQGGGPALENYFDGHFLWLRVWSRRLPMRERMLLYRRANSILGL